MCVCENWPKSVFPPFYFLVPLFVDLDFILELFFSRPFFDNVETVSRMFPPTAVAATVVAPNLIVVMLSKLNYLHYSHFID